MKDEGRREASWINPLIQSLKAMDYSSGDKSIYKKRACFKEQFQTHLSKEN